MGFKFNGNHKRNVARHTFDVHQVLLYGTFNFSKNFNMKNTISSSSGYVCGADYRKNFSSLDFEYVVIGSHAILEY